MALHTQFEVVIGTPRKAIIQVESGLSPVGFISIMGFKDPRDPRDPWAWRNTWTGEARTSYDELWVVIPLVVLVSVICALLLLPLFIYKFCPILLPKRFKNGFEKFLQVLHEVGKEKAMKHIKEISFDNPAFVRPSVYQAEQGRSQRVPMHLRSSTRSVTRSEYDRKRRTRSCPSRRRLDVV